MVINIMQDSCKNNIDNNLEKKELNQENFKKLIEFIFSEFKNQQKSGKVKFIGAVYSGISNIYFSDIDDIHTEINRYKEINMLFLQKSDEYKEIQIYEYTYDYFSIKNKTIFFYKNNELKNEFNLI